jgi:hypothetical protein
MTFPADRGLKQPNRFSSKTQIERRWRMGRNGEIVPELTSNGRTSVAVRGQDSQ